MNLSICIPTYNRVGELEKNLKMLCSYIEKNKLYKEVKIIVSDNASTDDTVQQVKDIESKNLKMEILLLKSEVNNGLTANFLKLLYETPTEYMMFLGDDDYISEEYLLGILQMLKENKVGVILPSYYNILPTGEKINRGRDLGKKKRYFKAGYKNCFINSWRAHQISGIVIHRNRVAELCMRKGLNNLYPQIFMVSQLCLKEDTIHFPDYPIEVTRPNQSNKNWGYGNDGLLSHVFQNYKLLDGISGLQRMLLEMKFIDRQYWRCAMYLKKGPIAFWRCIKSICIEKNATLGTRIFFPIYIILVFIKKAITLLFSGKLLATLKTKVDA